MLLEGPGLSIHALAFETLNQGRALSTIDGWPIALAAVALCLLYCGMMLYGSTIFVERLAVLGNDARDIPVAKWILTLVMPVGFALLGYRFLLVGWQVIRGADDNP